MFVKQLLALYTEIRLEAIGSIVNTGVYDFAVAATGMLSKIGLPLQQHYAQLSSTGTRYKFVGYGKTNDACSDYAHVESIQYSHLPDALDNSSEGEINSW
jgi:hypothetical protein